MTIHASTLLFHFRGQYISYASPTLSFVNFLTLDLFMPVLILSFRGIPNSSHQEIAMARNFSANRVTSLQFTQADTIRKVIQRLRMKRQVKRCRLRWISALRSTSLKAKFKHRWPTHQQSPVSSYSQLANNIYQVVCTDSLSSRGRTNQAELMGERRWNKVRLWAPLSGIS